MNEQRRSFGHIPNVVKIQRKRVKGEEEDGSIFRFLFNLKAISVLCISFWQNNLHIPFLYCQNNDCCEYIFNAKEWLFPFLYAKSNK